MGTQTAREIRLALCGPDICSRRQAYCIPHIGAAREGGNEQGGGAGWNEAEEEGHLRSGDCWEEKERSRRIGFIWTSGFFFWAPSRVDSLFSSWFLSFFSVHPSSCSFPVFYLTSVPPSPACTVVTVFLSAVCSAWHSVWRMMAIPEGGECALPSPRPLLSPHHYNEASTTQTREREGVLILPPCWRSRDAMYILPIFYTGITLLPLLATTTPLNDSVFVVSAPLLSSLCLLLAVVVCEMLLDDFVQTNLIWLSPCTL